MKHASPSRSCARLFLSLLAGTGTAWLFRDPIRTGVALLVAGAGLATESLKAAPQSRGSFNGFNVSNATIPTSEILSGGPGRDGIPSIDRPKFVRPNAANFMLPDDLVVSVTIGDKTRAYPLRILVWHEIVNDELGGQPIAVTYCPLCGTAMVFDRRVGSHTLLFGVSGLLYHSDVLMYDRQTESLWSQLGMKAISGPLVNTELQWLPSEHLTWAAWKKKYPDGEVLSTHTGFSRNYAATPYAAYAQSPGTMFPVPIHRTELPKKEWVVGVLVDGQPRAYPLNRLPPDQPARDQINSAALEITFHSVSQWVEVRRADSGELVPSVKVYWFAWQAFYPQTGLWQPK